jgi:hypothetical protein
VSLKFPQDVVNVEFDRPFRKEELICDLAVGEPCNHPAQYFELRAVKGSARLAAFQSGSLGWLLNPARIFWDRLYKSDFRAKIGIQQFLQRSTGIQNRRMCPSVSQG